MLGRGWLLCVAEAGPLASDSEDQSYKTATSEHNPG